MPHEGAAPRATIARDCLLAIVDLAGPPREVVRISVESNGTKIVIEVTPVEAAAMLGPPAAPNLLPLEAALLACLTGQEQTPKAVARKAGKNLGAHVYAALRSLVRKGVAERGERGGYRLPHSLSPPAG